MVGGILNQFFRLGINGGGGLVQNENGRIGQNCPRKRNQLLLACGQQASAFTHIAVISLFHFRHNHVRRHIPGRLLNLLIRCIQAAIPYIFPHSSRKQMRILQHITNLAVKPQLRPFPVIHAVNQYPSLCRFKETPHQVHKGRLSRPCLTHNGNIHAGRHMKVKMFQHIFLPVRVHKGNILKHNVSLDFFPITLIG